jgi:tRNA(Arg) A34 adenosine deaminase TadA
MDNSRRHFVAMLGVTATGLLSAPESTRASERKRAPANTPPDEIARHERFMRMAIEEARKNRRYPFGAVIVSAQTGELLARGVNRAGEHPALHGEMVAMNDYVDRHGNEGWASTTLYTTGEPCAMCMSAMVWAGLPRVVWGTSVDGIRAAGIPQIDLSARDVAKAASSFYKAELLLGGVLAKETDRLFYLRETGV